MELLCVWDPTNGIGNTTPSLTVGEKYNSIEQLTLEEVIARLTFTMPAWWDPPKGIWHLLEEMGRHYYHERCFVDLSVQEEVEEVCETDVLTF